MKTVCKKLLTFMLVAVLLVSAIPFQAFAAENAITLNVTGAVSDSFSSDREQGTVNGILAAWKDSWADSYKIASYSVEGQPTDPDVVAYETVTTGSGLTDGNAMIYAGQTLNVTLEALVPETEATKPATEPTKPETEPTKPATEPTKPETEPTQPETEATEPETEPTKPETEPTKPSVGGDTEEKEIEFVFVNKDGEKESFFVTTENGKLPAIDEPVDRDGWEFTGWFDDNGYPLPSKPDYASKYTARYTQKPDSYNCKLTVYGVIRNSGRSSVIGYPLVSFNANKGGDVLELLKAQRGTIKDVLKNSKYNEDAGYLWQDSSFYDSSDLGKDDKVATNTKVGGDRNYYIRIDYSGNEKVQIYVHTKNSQTIKDTVTLTNYAPGEKISKSIVTSAVKNAGWKFDSLKMYTKDEWDRIVDGGSSSEAPYFIVEEGGETEIHVRLYDGSQSSSSSKADSSNPKTGDSILMTVSVMGLSATALVCLFFFNKKRLAK